MIYYVEGTYGIKGHAEGGMAYFEDSVHIEKTLSFLAKARWRC